MSARAAANGSALLLCAVISACGSLDATRYAVPEGKPTAKLRIVYDDALGAAAKVFVVTRPLGENCRLDTSNIAVLASLGGSKNAITSYEPAWTRDVQLASGEPITLSISTGTISTTTMTTCGVRARFEPLKDAEYQMTFRSTPTQCFLTLGRRVVAADGTARLVAEPIVDPSPHCKK